jgi:DNA-binding NarL/FixJ family response regulator
MSQEVTRIYVVDDHSLVREWLSKLVGEQKDLKVCGQAATAKDGLAAMIKDPPDLAVVDLSLKGGSGLELIKDLKALLPQLPVLVLSMHEEIRDVERALRAGARGYVMKRDAVDQIIEAIRAVKAGRVFAGTEVLEVLAARMLAHPRTQSADPVEGLTDRELEIFRRIGQGSATREIASDLGLSIKTVQSYCLRIKEKLGVQNGSEVTRDAVRWTQRDVP